MAYNEARHPLRSGTPLRQVDVRLAIAGKGGVGKTTLASLLAMVYSARGKQVIAIDADPDANLAGALGIPPDEARRITPISQLKDLIEERTGAKPGTFGAYLKLNPKVDDIPDRFSARRGNVRLMILGTVKGGGSGCICPESALLRSLMSHLLLERSEVIIMDMEAGLEHLARGTADAVDAFIVVVEPGRRSLQTAEAIRKLAGDLGIHKCYVVGCKTQSDADRQFIIDNLPGFEVLGFISYNPRIIQADRQGAGIYEAAPDAVAEVEGIARRLDAGLPAAS
jgi:CO dehydrogenase maturation factor